MTQGKPLARPLRATNRRQKKTTQAWPHTDRRRNNEEIQDLLDYCDIGYIAIGPEGIIAGINAVARRWFGYSSTEMIARMNISTLLAEDFREEFAAELKQLQARGWARHLDGLMQCRDSTSFPAQIHIAAIRDHDGNFLRANVAIVNIRHLSKSERLLRELGEEFANKVAQKSIAPPPTEPTPNPVLVPLTERRRQPQLDGGPPPPAPPFGVERRRSVLSALSQGVVVFHTNGSIVTCNPTAQRILGLSDAMLAMGNCPNPDWCTHGMDGSISSISTHPVTETARTGNACRDIILSVRRPDGTVRRVSITTEPLFQPGIPQPQGVAMMIADVTDRYIPQPKNAIENA